MRRECRRARCAGQRGRGGGGEGRRVCVAKAGFAVNSRFLPAPGRSARPHAIPASRPAGHESAGEASVLCPAVRTHFACSIDDGALLLNPPILLSRPVHDSTAYLFAHRQKSPTNNPLGQRISHTVLSEFPDASLRTYPRLASREQGQSRPEKGHAQSTIVPLASSWLPGSGDRPVLPSLPATSDSTIAVAGTTESNGPRPSTVTGRTRSATSAACENQGSVMTRILAPRVWACIVGSKTPRW